VLQDILSGITPWHPSEGIPPKPFPDDAAATILGDTVTKTMLERSQFTATSATCVYVPRLAPESFDVAQLALQAARAEKAQLAR